MWFRNATLFRFPPESVPFLRDLDAKIEPFRLRAIGPHELSVDGFVSPFGRDSDALTHAINGFVLFAIATTEKILPASVVNDVVAAAIAKSEENEARRVGGKERKRIREDAMSVLLPQAFHRTSRTLAYADLEQRWLVVDTSSRHTAERVVSMLRQAFRTFPASPPTPEESPRQVMTGWMMDGIGGADLLLGEDCDLRDPAEAGATWSGRRADLESDEVREHLKSGMQVFRLGLNYDQRITFTLGEDLTIRKLRFGDAVVDQLGPVGDARAELDSTFALVTLELRRLLAMLEDVFHIPQRASLTLDGGDAPKAMRDAARAQSAEKRILEIATEDGGGRLIGDPEVNRQVKKAIRNVGEVFANARSKRHGK